MYVQILTDFLHLFAGRPTLGITFAMTVGDEFVLRLCHG